MDKRLQQELKAIYQPPKPQRKREFLNRIEETELSTLEFVQAQVGFIRKWNWGVGVMIFLLTLLGFRSVNDETVWFISAMLPFMALSTIAEMNRSARYGMEELELSARFSLRAVTLARLGVLGAGNGVLLTLLSPVVGVWGRFSIIETGFYILCPYCLTAFLNLVIVRSNHGKEGFYGCICVTGLVSMLCIFFGNFPEIAAKLLDGRLYVLATVVLLGLTGRECVKFVKQTEEYVWN